MNRSLQKIIFSHIPKTAGGSFGSALRNYFGDDYHHIRRGEYDPAWLAAPNVCIHGHFNPTLFNHADGFKVVTWMRHPLNRLISHYHHARSLTRRSKFWLGNNDFHRKLNGEKWTFERYALGEEHRNFCTRYIDGFDLRRFDFIGLVENFTHDYTMFCNKFLSCEPIPYRYKHRSRRRKPEVSKTLREKIEAHHADDMELYRMAQRWNK